VTEPSEEIGEVGRVAQALTGLGIGYALGGSMASSLLGVPRQTRDADLTVEPFPGQEATLAACFSSDHYVSVTAMREANRLRRSFNIINITTGFKVDLFVRKERPFEISAMARKIEVKIPDLPGQPLMVLTPEDVILFKLEWYRLGGETSDRQWSDILGVLRTQEGNLDIEYQRCWAADLQVSDLWDKAKRDAAS
jgi:hypothetical protein